MALDLVDYEIKAQKAVKAFWKGRAKAKKKQVTSGKKDQGERGSVTGGSNMNGFLSLVVDLIHANGLKNAEIHLRSVALTLPGYFRPTKRWDMLVTYKGELIAAIELKSQVGSFGNNYNNRTEEAIGTAVDFWTAYREGAFGKQPRPFVGWLMLIEDAPKSRSPVKDRSPHFALFPEFQGASYQNRYDLLCQKLVQDGLYTAAGLVSSPKTAGKSGQYAELSAMTGLRTFVTGLAGHVAAEVARLAR